MPKYRRLEPVTEFLKCASFVIFLEFSLLLLYILELPLNVEIDHYVAIRTSYDIISSIMYGITAEIRGFVYISYCSQRLVVFPPIGYMYLLRAYISKACRRLKNIMIWICQVTCYKKLWKYTFILINYCNNTNVITNSNMTLLFSPIKEIPWEAGSRTDFFQIWNNN